MRLLSLAVEPISLASYAITKPQLGWKASAATWINSNAGCWFTFCWERTLKLLGHVARQERNQSGRRVPRYCCLYCSTYCSILCTSTEENACLANQQRCAVPLMKPLMMMMIEQCLYLQQVHFFFFITAIDDQMIRCLCNAADNRHITVNLPWALPCVIVPFSASFNKGTSTLGPYLLTGGDQNNHSLSWFVATAPCVWWWI